MQEIVMAHRPVAATLASRADQPLSPPHSDHSSGKEVDREIDDNKPMDLSSGGPVAGVTNLFGRAFCETMPISDHPLLNARRLAELVRQQHIESEEREREGKRKWEDHEDEEDVNTVESNERSELQQNLIPLHLIRSKWDGAPLTPEQNENSPDIMENREDRSPGIPGSPAESSSGSESGREEKRRRLDMLLNKKFDKVTSIDNTNPRQNSTPPLTEGSLASDSHTDRRPSLDLAGPVKTNRRKQAHPSSPNSPPSLIIRPNSDLFPPIATSTPRDPIEDSQSTKVPNSRPSTPSDPQDYSPIGKLSRPQSPTSNPRSRSPHQEESDNKDAIKNQILQMQLASSGLLSGLGGNPPPELLKTLQYNPLLYYSYYAQMINALQAQQKLLELNTTPPTVPSANNNNNNNNNIKDLLSPLRLGGLAALNKDSMQDSRPIFSPHYQQSGQSPVTNLSPGGFKDDEPRKRAPRALTGRYVRTGTAASPRVLQILRKKVEDRLKLKELLGENSHLYFGGANKQQSPYKPLSQKLKKKF